MKEKLLVSFSGGETSAFMAQWIWNNWQEKYEMVFVFANTGEENEETLEFVDKCSNHFGFPVTWIEANVVDGHRKGTGFKIVDFKTASRKGEPFEAVIRKYGIPNFKYPHCTRETKLQPIAAFVRSLGWKNHYTAIGIRSDEVDRVNAKYKENKILYPLILDIPMTKPRINLFWSKQPFRLNLKGYQGNCKTCWKKSDDKLFTIAKENPEHFDFMDRMEKTYGDVKFNREGEFDRPFTFFRKNRSAQEILKQAEKFHGSVPDDSQNLNIQGDLFYDNDDNESCDIFSSCGD